MRITLLVVLALLTLTIFTGAATAHAGEQHAPGETEDTGGGFSGTTVVGGIAGLAAVIGIGWWLWTRYGRG